MNDDPSRRSRLSNEQLLEELARRDESAEPEDSNSNADSTVGQIKAELDTLASQISGPVPHVPFEEEAGCRRSIELVEAMESESMPAGNDSVQSWEQSDLGQLGQYQLLAQLGQGGMGTVYQALHTKLEKMVAIKVLPDNKTSDRQAVARFEREMRAVGKLEHANIVRAMDAGQHDQTHYLVMEFVDGEDLSRIVRRTGPLPIADACELVRQAAKGLQHAHDHGLVHRDIKPSNLMVSRQGQVKVLDLGLARLNNGHHGELTSTGQVMGTIDYMAPEQTGDSHDVDIRADIYSLGATLFKLLGGRAPYADPSLDSMIKKLNAMATRPVPSILEERSDVPEPLAAIVTKMLAKDPEERFQNPRDVADALSPFAHDNDLGSLLATMGPSLSSTLDPLAGPDDSTSQHHCGSLTETIDHIATGSKEGKASSGRPGPYAESQKSPSEPKRPRRMNWLVAAAIPIIGIVWYMIVLLNVETENGTLVFAGDPQVLKEATITVNGVTVDLDIQGEEFVIGVDKRSGRVRVVGADGVPLLAEDFTFEIGQQRYLLTVGIKNEPVVPNVGDSDQDYALVFDGEKSYVETPVHHDGKSPLTVEAWVMPRDLTNNATIFSQPGPPHIYITQRGETIAFSMNETSEDFQAIFSIAGLSTVRPVHVAAVYTDGNVTVFVDGKETNRAAIGLGQDLRETTPEYPKGRSFLIGWLGGDLQASGDKRFRGTIDEIHISSQARYHGDFHPERPLKADKHTIALYHCNEGSGTTLIDASGRGHHGQTHDVNWISATSGSSESNRLAAQWVLTAGGSVVVGSDSGSVIAPGEALPAGGWLLHSVLLQTPLSDHVTDESIEYLHEVRGLKVLHLQCPNLSSDRIRELLTFRSLENVTDLSLGPNVNADVLSVLGGRKWHSLSQLGFPQSANVTDEALEVFTELHGPNAHQSVSIGNRRN